MELRVFARLLPSLRCCLGTFMLVLSLCSPQYFGVSASAESACQPEFLLMRLRGFALDPDHAPFAHWPRPPPNWHHPLSASFPSCTLAPPLHCSLHPKDQPRPLLPSSEPLSLALTTLHLWPRSCTNWPPPLLTQTSSPSSTSSEVSGGVGG